MKYQALKETDIMQKLVKGILNQAAHDVLASKINQEKADAEIFIRSEYCELLCNVAEKEYSMLLSIVDNGARKTAMQKELIKRPDKLSKNKKALKRL